ncbi:MAG: hypothetical protein Kow0077_06340 [Anaerolineae bacterium]
MIATLTRLESALRVVFPQPTTVRFVLDAGCGAFETAGLLREVFPEAFIVGVDRSLERIVYRHAAVSLVADAARLPFSRRIEFDCILLRHPAPFRSRAGWDAVCRAVPGWLAPEGRVLVSCYDRDEMRLIEEALSHAGALKVRMPTDQLAPVALGGQDRFLAAFMVRPGKR